MAKYFGKIGFGLTEEIRPGVWTPRIEEHEYFGDVIKNTRRWQDGSEQNDDLTISNRISIVADAFAYQNFHTIRYIEWMGARWKIKNIEVSHPRLILEIGEVYNGQTGPQTESA